MPWKKILEDDSSLQGYLQVLNLYQKNPFYVSRRYQKEILTRRHFSEFLWILLSSVLIRAWCKILMWWVNYYLIGTFAYMIREIYMKRVIENVQLFSAGWRKGNKDCWVKKKRVGCSDESKSSTLWQNGTHLQVFTFLHKFSQHAWKHQNNVRAEKNSE